MVGGTTMSTSSPTEVALAVGDKRRQVTRNYLAEIPRVLAARVASFTKYINAYSCREVEHILTEHPLPYLRINLNFQTQGDAIPDEIEAETCRNWDFTQLKELTVCFFKKINRSVIETILAKQELTCFKVQCKELCAGDAMYACRFMPHAKQFHICHSELEEVDDGMMDSIRTSLDSNAKLETLLLSWTKFGPKLGLALSESLIKNETLRVLYLGRVELGDVGATYLSYAIAATSSIATLNVRHNDITGVGARHLCKALMVNSSVTELFLNLNVIGDEGAIALGEALRVNKSLTIVQLCSNEIGSDGTAALAHALRSNNTIRMLNMNNNVMMGDKGFSALCESIKVNQSLRELYLKNCNIGFIGAEYFASSLRVNKTLDILDLRDNDICDRGGTAIKAALMVNKNLQGILLSFNYVSECTIKQIERILTSHKREGFSCLWSGRGHSSCTLSFFLQYY